MSYTQPQPALPMMAGNWWALLLRGMAAVLFGLGALFWPGLTLFALIVLFGAYALVDGVFGIVAGIRSSGGRRWLLVAEGTLGVLAGLAALVWPGITAVVLLYIISFWAILGGLLRMATAILFRREVENVWAMITSGVLSVLLGVVLGALPGVGLLSLAWLIGVFALGVGTTLIWLAYRMRGQRS